MFAHVASLSDLLHEKAVTLTLHGGGLGSISKHNLTKIASGILPIHMVISLISLFCCNVSSR